jgi:hypothetical protein
VRAREVKDTGRTKPAESTKKSYGGGGGGYVSLGKGKMEGNWEKWKEKAGVRMIV